MPIHRGKDFKGFYYQWGNQTKYYYVSGDSRSRQQAYDRALKQAQAIYNRGYH